jgi:hypothetical protein
MTSINFITGTGFIKCIPITYSGLFVIPANLVIDIDDVLDANIVCLGHN